MQALPQIPIEDVAEYWQLVRAALVAGGMSKAAANTAAKAYRDYMKPAGWTIYNRDPEDSAAMAKKYTEWMRAEQQQQATSMPAAKRVKKQAKNTDVLPTKEEIAFLPRWARVAFAARCARKVIPLFAFHWKNAPVKYIKSVENSVLLAEVMASRHIEDRRAIDLMSDANAAALAAYSIEFFISYFAAEAATNAVTAAATIDANNDESSVLFCHMTCKSANSAGDSRFSNMINRDFQRVVEESRLRKWTDATPVPPAVFGPLWPEGPPANWPQLPKPTKLKLNVRVPDGMDDATVLTKLKMLTTALARLNIAGGGHSLELIRPINYTQDQEKGRVDVVQEENAKSNSLGKTRRAR